jgi:hypothetical protein
LSRDPDQANAALGVAMIEQETVSRGLERLSRLMKEWQSYASLVRAFKALREIEKGVVEGIEDLSGNKKR